MGSRARSRWPATQSKSRSKPRSSSRQLSSPALKRFPEDGVRRGPAPSFLFMSDVNKTANTIGAVMARARTAGVEQAWEGLDRAHAKITAALEHDMVPEAGMPLVWYEVLLHLSRTEGGLMRYQDLAKLAGITNSGASRRLEQM